MAVKEGYLGLVSNQAPRLHPVNLISCNTVQDTVNTATPHDPMKPNPKNLVAFFSQSLTSFQSSKDVFRVLCTLPHHLPGTPAPRKPTTTISNLIVLDSSFNPPTTAHAAMARAALREGHEARRLVLLLSVNNADKAPQPASFPVRLGMMEGFGRELAKETGAEIDVAVTTQAFFHDKARGIAGSGFYGGLGEQTFLAGFDTLVRIFDPRYYAGGMRVALGGFFGGSRLRVTMRPDGKWGSVGEQREYVEGLEGGKLESMGGDGDWVERIRLVEDGGVGVSSSKVREVVKTGEGELDGLVGEEVREWIEREGLYKE